MMTMKKLTRFMMLILSLVALFLALPALAQSAPAVVAAVPDTKPAWERVLLAILNSEAFVTLIGAAAAWLVAMLFTKKPEWKRYEGLMITAIKTAEKVAIPEGTTNTGLLKAKAAADAFSEQYLNHYGVPPTEQTMALVSAAIPIVHDQLDSKGTL